MEEVLALADRVTVLRDGRYVGDLTRAEATHEKIVSMMVGRELSAHYFPEKRPRRSTEPVLVVEGLVVPGAPAPVSFSAERGEILGFAGLVGSGRTELMQTIFGVTPALGGRMTLEGEAFAPRRPRDAIDRGVYLAPEDRKRHGLVLPLSVAENTSLPDIGNYNRWGFLDRKRERPRRRIGGEAVADEDAWHPSARREPLRRKPAEGGARKMAGHEPARAPRGRADTRDRLGARGRDLPPHGRPRGWRDITILMVSSDMGEIIGMSGGYRVAVMHERRIKGVLPRERLSQERIATLMTGHAGEEALS